MSEISLSLPCFTRSTTFSTIASTVVVGGNLRDVDAVDGFVVAIPRAHAEAAASGPVNLLDGLCIVNELASAGEVRRQQGGGDVVLRVAHQGNRRLADLRQVKWQMELAMPTAMPVLALTSTDGKARGQQVGSFKVLS